MKKSKVNEFGKTFSLKFKQQKKNNYRKKKNILTCPEKNECSPNTDFSNLGKTIKVNDFLKQTFSLKLIRR